MSFLRSVKEFAHRHKKWEPLVFFIAGFSFDATLLHRIDDPLMLVHQAIYLSLCAFIIAWDLINETTTDTPSTAWKKLWAYREGFLHFMLGTLLNVYTIFYFKSGTIVSSVIFLLILASLLYLNEVRPAGVSKHLLRNALFGLCLMSYLNIVVSIAMGSIGVWVFLIAVGVAIAIETLFIWILSRNRDARLVWRETRLPLYGAAALYLILYFTKILPPVPLSVKYMGIYHDIARVEGGYKLTSTRPAWMFWEHGDQTFNAKPGDKIFSFVQVYSPTRFKEQLFVRWKYHDPKVGWTGSDAIPLSVVGGRAEGFRGFTQKTNYQPGDWRVMIETADGREVGRIGLTVRTVGADAATELREEVR